MNSGKTFAVQTPLSRHPEQRRGILLKLPSSLRNGIPRLPLGMTQSLQIAKTPSFSEVAPTHSGFRIPARSDGRRLHPWRNAYTRRFEKCRTKSARSRRLHYFPTRRRSRRSQSHPPAFARDFSQTSTRNLRRSLGGDDCVGASSARDIHALEDEWLRLARRASILAP